MMKTVNIHFESFLVDQESPKTSPAFGKVFS
jgi:hypothetical protein